METPLYLKKRDILADCTKTSSATLTCIASATGRGRGKITRSHWTSRAVLMVFEGYKPLCGDTRFYSYTRRNEKNLARFVKLFF